MEKLKKILPIIIVVLLILIIIVIVLIKNKNNFITKDSIYELEGVRTVEYKSDKIENVKELALYNLVESKLSRYVNDIYEKDAERIIDVLDEDYIKSNNINSSNVFDKVSKVETYSAFTISEIEKYNIYGHNVCIVTGNIKPEDEYKYNEETHDWYKVDAKNDSSITINILFTMDFKNLTYSIKPISNEEKVKYEQSYTNENIEILENDNNKFKYIPMATNEIISYYMKEYKELVVNDVDKSYDLLNEEYRNKRFGNIQEYRNYVRDNKDDLCKIMISKYKVDEYDGYKEYTFIDDYNNYYIIKEMYAMEYKIYLDTYTIDSEEFIKKYDESTNRKKVELNIGKFINALNNVDYKYIYNHLDQEFRNNNYKTIDEFIQYCKLNFFKNNSISLSNYNEQDDIYVYDLELKNSSNESEIKVLRIVLKLEENRGYVMSFSME